MTTPVAVPPRATPVSSRPGRADRHGRSVPGRRSDRYWVPVFILPALLLAVLFKFLPLALGMYQSTRQWVGVGSTSVGVGLDNYRRLFEDPMTRTAFRNAVVVVLTLPIWVLLPLVLAFLIHQRSPGWQFFRSVYFLPYTIAPIVIGVMFRQILAPDGPLNALIRATPFDFLAQTWLSNTATALPSLVAVALWSFFGFGVITYLAGLATIPEEVLEAAELDGAGYWAKLFRIIVPLMKSVIGYWTVLCASGMLVWMFPLIYALTQGGPGTATMLPEFLVFLTTFQFLERGYGTTIGMALFVFVALISGYTVRHMYVQATRGDDA